MLLPAGDDHSQRNLGNSVLMCFTCSKVFISLSKTFVGFHLSMVSLYSLSADP